MAEILYTNWLGDMTFTSEGEEAQEWSSVHNVSTDNNNSRATLPNNLSWSAPTQKLLTTSNFVNFSNIIPAGSTIVEISMRIYYRGFGLITEPYREMSHKLATSSGVIGNPVVGNTNSGLSANTFRTYEGSPIDFWGLSSSEIAAFTSGGGVGVWCSSQGSGNIGVDAINLKIGYTLPVSRGTISTSLISGKKVATITSENELNAIRFIFAKTSGLPLSDSKLFLGGIPISTYNTGNGLAVGVFDISENSISGIDWENFQVSNVYFTYFGNKTEFYTDSYNNNIFAIGMDDDFTTADTSFIWQGIPVSKNSNDSIIANSVTGNVSKIEKAVIGGIAFLVATIDNQKLLVVGS